MRGNVYYFIGLLTSFALVSCNREIGWKMPAASVKNERGAVLFSNRCTSCHGGALPVPRNLTALQIKNAIDTKPSMAGVRDLALDDVNAIAQYLSDAADNIPPTAPGNLRAVAGSFSIVNLSWQASTDEGGSELKGYKLFRKDSGDFVLVNDLIARDKTSYSDQNLTEHTFYTYRIVAIDNNNNTSTSSAEVEVTTPGMPTTEDTTSPSAPSALKTTVSNYWSISLAWNESTDEGGTGLKEYQIFRDGVWINTVGPTDLTYLDNNKKKKLSSNTEYSYQILAVDGHGNRSQAAFFKAKTPPITSTDLEALITNNCNGCHGTSSNPLPRNRSGEQYAQGMEKNTTMQGLLKVLSQDEINAIASYFSDASDNTPPSAPQLSEAGKTDSTVNLSWKPAEDRESGVLNYRLFRNGVLISDKIKKDETSFLDISLAAKTTYKYKLSAVNANMKESLPSNEVSVETLSTEDKIPPAPPLNLALDNKSSTYKVITLKWDAATDQGGSGIKEYLVFRNGSQIGKTSSTFFSDSSIVTSQTYAYKIKAVDGQNNLSPFSVDFTVNPPGVQSSDMSLLIKNQCFSCHSNIQAVQSKFYDAKNPIMDFADFGSRLATMGTLAQSLSPEEINALYDYLSDPSDMTPPPAPSNLTVKDNTPSLVTLNWAAPTAGSRLKGYRISRTTGTSSTLDFSEVLPRTETSFSDNKVKEQTKYNYTLTAFDFNETNNKSKGNSTASISAQTPARPSLKDISPPNAPTNLTVDSKTLTYKSLILKWNAASDNGGGSIKEYLVFRDNLQIKTPKPITSTSFTDTSVISNTNYSYQVKAMDNSANTSPLSAAVSVTTPEMKPADITQVIRSQCLTCHSDERDIRENIRSYKITSLAIFKAHPKTTEKMSILLQATNTDRPSDDELSKILTYLSDASDASPPSAPVLSVSSKTSSTVNLSWTVAVDNESGVKIYKLFRNNTLLKDNIAKDITSYADSSLSAKTTYKYKLIAINFNNKESSSNELSVETLPVPVVKDTSPPNAPTNLSIDNKTLTYKSLILKWDAATDNGGGSIKEYLVLRDGIQQGKVASNSFTDETVISMKTYSYQVKAVDTSANTSPLSAAVSVTTPAMDVSFFIKGNTTTMGTCTGCHDAHPTELAILAKFAEFNPKIDSPNKLKIRLENMGSFSKDLSPDEINNLYNYLSAKSPKPSSPPPQAQMTESTLMTFNPPLPVAQASFSRLWRIFRQSPSNVLHKRFYNQPSSFGGGCSRYDVCAFTETSNPSPNWNAIRAGHITNGCSELISDSAFNVDTVLTAAGLPAKSSANSANIKVIYAHFLPGYSPSPEVLTSLEAISTASETDPNTAWKNIFLPLCETSAGGAF